MQNTTNPDNPTNEQIIQLIGEFQETNSVDIFTDIETEDDAGTLNMGVDQGFIEFFEEKYPKAVLDEALQGFFENLIQNFAKEMESNPEFAEDIKEKSKDLNIV